MVDFVAGEQLPGLEELDDLLLDVGELLVLLCEGDLEDETRLGGRLDVRSRDPCWPRPPPFLSRLRSRPRSWKKPRACVWPLNRCAVRVNASAKAS